MSNENAALAAPALSLFHRSLAGAGAAVVSAIVVNPLDVVKTRLQAQGFDLSTRTIQPATSLLEKWNFAGCGATCVRLADPGLPPAACGPACEPPVYRGTLHALRTIARAEGPAALWRGTHVALMMAVPMVGIYLPLYDSLLERLQRQGGGGAAPLLAGTLARTAAVYCTAPFELIRVRMQAAPAVAVTAATAGVGGPPPVRVLLQHAARGGGGGMRTLGKLWTGVGATLARDVPFSGLYWAMVEPIRGGLLPTGATSELQVLGVNAAAGGAAGGLAGAITTPLDVVKTRTQLAGAGQAQGPMLGVLRSIAATEGLPALFQGWSARAAKAAPACAIVLSAYEMLKWMPMAVDD